MKFKVGDKVRVVEDSIYYEDMEGVFAETNKGNAVGVISYVDPRSSFPYMVKIDGIDSNSNGFVCLEEELALVEE